MDIDITLKLPEDLVQRARAEGILTSQRIAQLLEIEMERIQHWRNLDEAFIPVRESFGADHATMTEDEVMDMLTEIVHEVRTESLQNASDTQKQ